MSEQENTENENKAVILVVDDSRVMRKSASKMLSKEFEVVLAEDGMDGWEKLSTNQQIAMVFTDLNMPKLNGYQLIEKIRSNEDEGIRNLPVVVITGAENDDEAKDEALNIGATDFIVKPFNTTDLIARARAYSNYHRETKNLKENTSQDAVTGMLNKKAFQDQVDKHLAFVNRHQQSYVMTIIELDNFEQQFVKIGRKGADMVLSQIGKILVKTVRKEETPGRIGLARFAVSSPSFKFEGVENFAERVRNAVTKFKAKMGGDVIKFSVSIGIFHVETANNMEYELIMQSAETALQQAIDAGGNRLAVERDQGLEAREQMTGDTSFGLLERLMLLSEQNRLHEADNVLDQFSSQLALFMSSLPVDKRRVLMDKLQGIR